MTLETLLDKARIEAVLMAYASALDQRDWRALEDVFVSEASADYGVVGEFHGRVAVVGVVRDFLERCGGTQHLLGNIRVSVEGDAAHSRCYLQATHAGVGTHLGQTMTLWGEYRDQLERREEGWRIVRRELHVQHVAGDVGVQFRA
ncbi:TPA: nuclear transport factor 2 family protein [Pseudomonas aeruginosa]